MSVVLKFLLRAKITQLLKDNNRLRQCDIAICDIAICDRQNRLTLIDLDTLKSFHFHNSDSFDSSNFAKPKNFQKIFQNFLLKVAPYNS